MTKFQDIPRFPKELMLRTTCGEREQFHQEDGRFSVSINESGSVTVVLLDDTYDWDTVEFNEDSIEYAAWNEGDNSGVR